MNTYKNLELRIQKKYKSLPKNQKKIADFMLEHFDSIPFLNVDDISKETGTSVASIVRFSQRIGLSGFSELREKISGAIQKQIGQRQESMLIQPIEKSEKTLDVVARQDMTNISDTVKQIDRDHFKHAIGLLTDAHRVFTMGLGISYFLAEILAYQLNQVSIDSRAFSHTDASFFEQLLFLDESDLLVGFSFPPYSKDTVDAAKFAKERNVKVLSITNKSTAPIVFYSTTTLIVKSKNILFTNSFAAISVLINALATEYAVQNSDKAEQMLSMLNKIREMYNHVTI
jgi:DNA-binding MurR/RpiR family transcriptional regulator